MHIDEAKWITPHIMANQNSIHSCLVLAEKEKFEASTLSHKICPRKQNTEPKLLIFSQEKLPHTLISLQLFHPHIV